MWRLHGKVCGTLREHAMKIINFRTETMKILTTEQQESYKMQKYAIFLYKNLKINMQYCKVNDHC